MRASLVLLVVASGCGVSEVASSVSRERAALVGGVTDDGGFRDVVMLRAVFTNDAGQTQGFACTGTVITPRVVLTAAHCLNERGGPPGYYAFSGVFFHNLTVAPPTSSPQWVAATSWRRHPGWTSGSAMNLDIGVVELPAPIAGVTPSPYLTRPLVAGDVGRPMAVVGYGITSSGGSGAGTRRVVTLPLRGLTSQHLQLGNMSTAGICNGDSGGPSFVTDRDGIRRVAGVHSWTIPSGNCMDGLDTRVDLYGPFIRQFLMDTGGASCVEDGLCASGCPGPDPDCVCQADGMCNGQCPNLLSDPDCPADCVANGVCATQACPRLDPDCVAELSTCTADAQCQSRTCATDPQRPARYCSRVCSAGCPGGTSCVGTVCLLPQLPTAMEGQPCTVGGTFCLGSTVCSGALGGALTCRRACLSDATCASTEECVAGQNAVRVCEPKPPEAMPGEPCVGGVTRCLGGTSCSGLLGGPTTCRLPCTGDASCTSAETCVDGANGVRICAPRTPPVALGEPCTPGVSRCVAPAGCTGVPGGATTCRLLCIGDAQCPAAEECVPGQGQLRVCVVRPPEAMPGAPCDIGMTRCLLGTTCTGLPGDATTCLATCSLETDCAASEVCARGQHDAGVCRPQPVFVEPITIAESPQPKTGCAATPGAASVPALALLARRRRQLRRFHRNGKLL